MDNSNTDHNARWMAFATNRMEVLEDLNTSNRGEESKVSHPSQAEGLDSRYYEAASQSQDNQSSDIQIAESNAWDN